MNVIRFCFSASAKRGRQMRKARLTLSPRAALCD